jgi:hypothetical protein
MEPMPGAAELAEAFARDGVVCVRSALDPAGVAAGADDRRRWVISHTATG